MDADLPLPPTPSRAGPLPRVVAVLVVRDGAEWLGHVLATIAAQRYPTLELVVVDNASRDASPEILARRIPAERLVTLPRPVGYGRAVTAALQNAAFDAAELVLLLHDDLALAPDALNRLTGALRQDATLGVVGPKLRDWGEEPVLQEVGMTIDRLGRAESILEQGERDQGQHDSQRDVLYVSSAGMLVRLDVLRQLGGFDPRFSLFRDDLDLCWRAWLAGWRVAVEPSAVGYHVAAASRMARDVGSARSGEARYLAERHTIATLLKNYGAPTLLWVLPMAWLLGIGKVAGFAVTRRFGDALAVVRAWLWNLAQLPATLRRRRFVQSRRELSDHEMARLLAPGLPRVRTYVEVLGSWLAGGGTRALIEDTDVDVEDIAEGRALARAVRDHPVAAGGLGLLVLYLVGVASLLGGGPLVGGEVTPWPAQAREFFQAYLAPLNGEPLGSAAFPSPAQPLLGLVSLLGFGSSWLAQRVVVLGLVPVAWMLAVRAGRLLTARPVPRMLGATVYAVSPPVLGALSEGRFGTLVAAALLPGVVLLAARTADPQAPPATAWRAAALLAIVLVATASASLGAGLLLAVGWLVALPAASRAGRPGVVRLSIAGGAALLLLAPWLAGLVQERAWPAGEALGLPLWRAVALAPLTLTGLEGLGGWLLAALAAAALGGAVLLGLQRRPGAVAGLGAAWVAAALGAWALARWPLPVLSPDTLLVVAAGALAGLVVVAARWFVEGLGQHAFGARQVAVAVAVTVFAVSLVAGVARVVGGPWTSLERGAQVVPAFVAAEAPRVGHYRILRLDEAGGEIHWEALRARGPTMLAYGATPSRTLREFIGDAVAGAIGGADPAAGARLGLANVRYIVADTGGIRDALAGQPWVDPLPAGNGRVFRVQTWLPRAAVVPAEVAQALAEGRDPGPLRQYEDRALRMPRMGALEGEAPEEGVLVVSEAADPAWRAGVDGQRLARQELLAVNAFAVPEPGSVSTRLAGGAGHRALVAGQVLLALAILSLALRPPGTTQQRAEAGRLPSALTAAEDEPVLPEVPS